MRGTLRGMASFRRAPGIREVLQTRRALKREKRRAEIERIPLAAGALDGAVARNEHGIYFVPSAYRGIVAQTVRRGRVWEPDTLALLNEIDGDVVHAGAFFGDFLPALARRDATVWAFEPNRLNFRASNVTVLLNDLDNVVVTRAGLSDRPGEARVTTSNRSGVASGGASQIVFSSNGNDEAVPLATIDLLIPADRDVGVIHLDVEGHEQSALAGALQTIERCKPVLVIETVPSADWLASHLPGYRKSDLIDANTVLRPG
jgi:FkbM family methyltransferase